MFRRILGPFTRWLGTQPRRRPERSSGRPQNVRPRLEALEDRLTPTVTAAFSAGTLTVTLDSGPGTSAATIQELPPGGGQTTNYKIFGDGVALNNGVAFTGVQNISVVAAGSGADELDLVGDKGGGVPPSGNNTSALPGTFSVAYSGGNALTVNWGDNQSTATGAGPAKATGGFNVNGAVSLSSTGTGFLNVVLGDGATGTGTNVNNTLGTTTITGGTGGTQFFAQAATVINGGLTINDAGPGNTTILDGAVVNGSLTQNSTAINDLFTLRNLTNVQGSVTYNGTAANSGVTANLQTATVGGNFNVTTGTGSDQVNITANSLVGGNTALALGGGTNTVLFQDSVINGNLTTADAGADNITMKLTNNASGGLNRVGGFVSLNNTAATSASSVTVDHASIGTFLSVVSGAVNGGVVSGSGNDTVTVTNTSIGTAAGNQNFQNNGVDLGGGSNTVTYTNDNIVGTFFTDGNGGTDTFTNFSNNNFGFDAKFNDAASALLTVTGTADHINDGVFIASGAGNDHFTLTNSSVGGGGLTDNAGTGSNDQLLLTGTTIEGSVAVGMNNTGGNGADFVQLTNCQVHGSVTVSAGNSAGAVGVILPGTAITGALSITTGSGNDVIEGAQSVGGLVTINSGNASTGDSVSINNQSTYYGGLSITTGNGADTVNVGTGVLLNTDTQIFGTTSVSTGAGNDTINLGGDAKDVAQFFGAVTIDGGAPSGANTLNDTNAQFFGALTVSNIP